MQPDDPNAPTKPPVKILAFDSTTKKREDASPVDLDSPFFEIADISYAPDKCNHRNRGVTLDTATRTAICKCGVTIDLFDALLIYAHAQRRLVFTRQRIEEHEAKRKEEAERKAAKCIRSVAGYVSGFGGNSNRFGFTLTLECGHEMYWHRSKPPRRATCETCLKNARQQAAARAAGIVAVGSHNKAPKKPTKW